MNYDLVIAVIILFLFLVGLSYILLSGVKKPEGKAKS